MVLCPCLYQFFFFIVSVTVHLPSSLCFCLQRLDFFFFYGSLWQLPERCHLSLACCNHWLKRSTLRTSSLLVPSVYASYLQRYFTKKQSKKKKNLNLYIRYKCSSPKVWLVCFYVIFIVVLEVCIYADPCTVDEQKLRWQSLGNGGGDEKKKQNQGNWCFMDTVDDDELYPAICSILPVQ